MNCIEIIDREFFGNESIRVGDYEERTNKRTNGWMKDKTMQLRARRISELRCSHANAGGNAADSGGCDRNRMNERIVSAIAVRLLPTIETICTITISFAKSISLESWCK